MTEFDQKEAAIGVVEVQYELERSRREVKELSHLLKEQKKLQARVERELGILESVGHRSEPPKWLTKSAPAKKKGKHRATPWFMLSDLHLDEVVRHEELGGVNAFNRQIAELRLEKLVNNAVGVARDYWTGLSYDGIVVPFGGDNFSGDIHDELTQTNEDTMIGSVDYWIDPLAAALLHLADEFGKVHVPVVTGNHGRTTRKPHAKHRARSNWDWMIGRALQRAFKSDPRVTFDIPEDPDCRIAIYGQHVLLTHGDQTTGGSGIGGIWPPIMRLKARKAQRYAAVGQPFDLLIMGHWHQLVFGPDFIINGSLKGYDEYAASHNFGFEPPQQGMWLMTPEHGITWRAPVLCQDREKEAW